MWVILNISSNNEEEIIYTIKVENSKCLIYVLRLKNMWRDTRNRIYKRIIKNKIIYGV